MTLINGDGMGRMKAFTGGRKAGFSARICLDPQEWWQGVKRGHNR